MLGRGSRNEKSSHLPIVYSFLHRYRRTTSITDGKLTYHRYRPYRWTRFWRATLCPCNNANYLIHERILHIYRSCIHFSIRTDGQLRFTDGQLVYHRYRPYRWTRFFGGLPYALAIMLTTSFTKGFCTFTDRVFISPSVPTDNIYYRWKIGLPSVPTVPMNKVFGGLPYALAIMLTTSFTKGFCTFTDRVFISPSVPTDNFDLPMDNWFTIGTDRTDGQGFWGATLCPCNNANYLIHERILHIYRSCIHFSIRTDGQLRFTDGQLVYHRYRPYRWTRFFGGLPYALAIMLTTSFTKGFCTFTDRVFISPSVPTDNIYYRWKIGLPSVPTVPMNKVFGGLPYALAIMLTTSFTKGFCTFTDRVFISPSVPTDNFDLPMDNNWFTIGTDRTDGQGFWGLPYALAIMLTTSFTKGFCTFTDRVFISPSVPTDNFDLPMDNWFTIGTDRTDGQDFWGATLCPCNNANYLIHERILHIYRSCIHFSIRTDGQLRFTDGQLVYHRYRPYRWTRFFGGLPYALAIMLTTSFTKGFCTFTDRVFISPSVPTDNIYYRWKIGLPSVPTVPMDKVLEGYLMPLQ